MQRERSYGKSSCVYHHANSHKCTSSPWICQIPFLSVCTPDFQEWQQGPKCAQRLDRSFFPRVLSPVLNNFIQFLEFLSSKKQWIIMPYLFSLCHFIDISHILSEPFLFLNYGASLYYLFQNPWHCWKKVSHRSPLLVPVLRSRPPLVLACNEPHQSNLTKKTNFNSGRFPHWLVVQLQKHRNVETKMSCKVALQLWSQRYWVMEKREGFPSVLFLPSMIPSVKALCGGEG